MATISAKAPARISASGDAVLTISVSPVFLVLFNTLPVPGFLDLVRPPASTLSQGLSIVRKLQGDDSGLRSASSPRLPMILELMPTAALNVAGVGSGHAALMSFQSALAALNVP